MPAKNFYKKRILKYYILSFILAVSFQIGNSQTVNSAEYDPSAIVIKLKSSTVPQNTNRRTLQSTALAEKLTKMGVTNQRQLFPQKMSSTSRTKLFQYDLSGIYKLKLDKGQNIETIIRQLQLLPEIEYAEPYFLPKPLYIPNDPDSQAGGPQDYLEVISAYSAWNVERGDSNIVIGVLDTGVRLDHEDLKDNIKYNYDDPINGIDDEGDGYIDNFYGWDISNNDNDPSDDQSTHGTRVAGLNGTTNNNIGLAGVGFN